ncbi:TPA: hypothetical protein JBD37_12155 [Legionella pneumophila subsp. pneumophila]|uniref:Uncharacterized protein n=2 Tax=Legionella pneumophila TaxID=446 RepID=A0AAN5PPN9_LEGPN|nr:hypothetical protein [Legionella pneumophila]AMV14901.1 hypothetical protein ULM_22360 [Legionella pneumophila]ANN94132.1 hypothetical protein A9P85_10785 [Legionella pneumophila]APF04801.1 hypothetical protein BIZ52_11730 [Legionella pneumophila subsp. fraseri]MCH9061592.1 hypothetical protein [Legionella pneumophila serogroup 1]MCH9064382.1 hypothetical protein [Legionella pneumophila serogroup 1]
MIRKNNPVQSVIWKGLKIFGKISLLVLQAIVAFASDEKDKPHYVAGKATELYEDGAISGSEYARHIHGD